MEAERDITNTETVETFDTDKKCDDNNYVSIPDFLAWIEEAKAKAPEVQREKLVLLIQDDIELCYHEYETDQEMADRLREEQEEALREKLAEENKLKLSESGITVSTDGERVLFVRPYGSGMSISIRELEQAIAHAKAKRPELAAAA